MFNDELLSCEHIIPAERSDEGITGYFSLSKILQNTLYIKNIRPMF